MPTEIANQYPIRQAIRKALLEAKPARMMPLVALSFAGLASPALGQQAAVELSNLNGSNGFVLNGPAAAYTSGTSVSSAGDVNGDGVDDLVIGAGGSNPNGSNSGSSYVVFGASGVGNSGTIELSALDGNNGFVLNGVAAGDATGNSVSAAGDVNDDGIDDLLIGAVGADTNGKTSGASYVVFGSNQRFTASIELSDLNGNNGFVLNGEARGDFSGQSVSAAGDVNGDGVDDLIIGAIGAYSINGIGTSYVVFGNSEVGSSGMLELSALDGSNGFALNGVAEDDDSGESVSAAGDINGDGIDDLLIGADGIDFNGRYSGASYVVFGASGVGESGTVELSTLNGNNGFVLNGVAAGDSTGNSVSAAGDVNDDGIDDLLIGALGVDTNGRASGASYVVFGSNQRFTASIELSDLDDNHGFVINGETDGDLSGNSVSAAGDVNGDGVDDLLIGARGASPNTRESGASYVVFGTSDLDTNGTLAHSDLNGSNGFVLNGAARDDHSGSSVSEAGDINNDGIDDLLIGAVNADPNGATSAGASYVVFGRVDDDTPQTTLNIQVSTSSDDAEESIDTGNVKPGSSDLEMGNQGNKNQLVGLRFNDLNIPEGATITNAYIQFQVDESHSGNTSLIIEGEATDNALTFTNTNANISTRDRTNTVVDWDPKPWTTIGEAGTDQQTPNITSIIQEIIDRQGWSSGNSLAIIVTGLGRRSAESFNGDAAGAPLLHVKYQ